MQIYKKIKDWLYLNLITLLPRRHAFSYDHLPTQLYVKSAWEFFFIHIPDSFLNEKSSVRKFMYKAFINMGRNVNIHFFKLLMQMELVEH